MYTENPPDEVYYFYGVYQNFFLEIEKIKNVKMNEGLPTQSVINELSSDGKHKLIILDDLMHAILQSSDMELLFTQGCHHRNISVIYITQNLYQQGRYSRTIALNTWYVIMFRNLRDVAQIKVLGRQLYPRNACILVDAYEKAIKEAFGHLIIDSGPRSKQEYRLRTNVFPNQDCTVYIPKI